VIIPTYTYRPTHHDWELSQDGYVLGWMKRMPTKGGHSEVLRVSVDGEVWQGAFLNRKAAREHLQTL